MRLIRFVDKQNNNTNTNYEYKSIVRQRNYNQSTKHYLGADPNDM